MIDSWIQKLVGALILFAFTLACGSASPSSPTAQATVRSESIADTMAVFEQEIPARMQVDGIPGLVIAVVDDRNVLWMESFGYTDWDGRTPVTPSTIFSIQSMSKSFTATAAMIAAQEGLVDLDEPITTYLPNFTVHSIFEEHPERKMTLRTLLSHTAGFPHDTSYGNNNDHPADYSFEKHIASISDTWLMFPVATRYGYSNVGIDLAGYILEVRSGMPFVHYIQQKVLDPLGMKDSTLDVQRVRATPTRAIGHDGIMRPPVEFLFIPSGGVWASAEDLARYVQFHINGGILDGKVLLKADLAETMYTPPNLPAEHAYVGSGYALGLSESTRNGAHILYHGGGAFGFANQMAWYPELKLGAVVLTNAADQSGYAFELENDVLDSIINSDLPLYRQRYVSATRISAAYPPDSQGTILTNEALRQLIAGKAVAPGENAAVDRTSYAGTYVVSNGGFPGDTFTISDTNGRFAWTYAGGEEQFAPNATLTEVGPGLLMSENGNTFNLSGAIPLADNIALRKINPQALPLKIPLYALCGLVFLSALFFWPMRALIWRIRKSGASSAKSSSSLVATSSLAALASLLSLLCLALIALVPNLIYFPWPRPYRDLIWWQFALVGMPFISSALAVGTALIAGLVLRGRFERWYLLAVVLALLVFNAVIQF